MNKAYFKFLKIILTFSILSFFSFSVKSQSSSWLSNPGSQKVFIENQGQFHIHKSNEPVLFAYEGGPTTIYFTKKGISYSFLKRWAKEEDKDEGIRKYTSPEEWKEKEAEERRMEYESDAILMTWENANPDVEVVAYDMTADYHSYCLKDKGGKAKNINFIKAYKKIVYKNIYPNIDIEYVFHPSDGLKYSVILHPGADISKVKMNYSGMPEIKANGDIHITTKFGDIIDHAPATFYSDNKSNLIASHFVKNGYTITFDLKSFDNNKTIVIDPWTQTPALPNSNGVWECERDATGNVYIIGGDMPMCLYKYSSAGALIWTYETPYDTANNWLGTFATDLAGNSFVTSGSIAALQKINTGAGLEWDAPTPLFNTDEYWNIAFNCDQTKLIVGGTTGSMAQLQGAIFDINTSDGSVNNVKVVGYGNMYGFPPIIEEVRSITSCRNSRYYFLTLDTIGAIEDDFSACPTSGPAVFRINNGYSFAYKCENYRPNNGNSGIMSIRANRYFVYTQNGTTIDQRSLVDGSIIASAAIPGGISTTSLGRHQAGNSGLDIDSCGYVYVGSGNGVYKFDANLNPVPAATISTSYKVFDVNVSTGGNVIFCGATGTNSDPNRTGTIQSANMSACLPMTLYCCNSNICPVEPICNTASPITLTAATSGGTWSGQGVDPSTGVFDPGAVGEGTYTITYTLPCGESSINVIVNPCATLSVCQELNGDITVSGGTGPYSWQTGHDSLNCSGCPLGQCIPLICNGVMQTIWTTFATGTTVTPPGSDTIRVVDVNNNYTVINDTAELPACVICPTITISISNVVDVDCSGNLGSFTASSSGGNGPYNYTLLLGGTTIATFNNVSGPQNFTDLVAGTYTLNVLDADNCPGTISIEITSPSNMTLNFTSVDESCSGSCNGQLTCVVTGGVAPYTFAWSNGQGSSTITNLCGGNYTVTVTDGTGCSKVDFSTVSTGVVVNLVLTPENTSCSNTCDGQISSAVSGGTAPYTYHWGGGQTTSGISNLCVGNYTLTVTDSNGCTRTMDTTVATDMVVTANFTADPLSGTIPLSVTFDYTGTGATSWFWDFGDGSTFDGENPPPHVYDSINTYVVTLIVSSGVCEDTFSLSIEVQKPSMLVIPNVFTPNGDSHNDEFIMDYKEIESFKCTIFNRWGKKIYEWTDITKGWNGKTNGNNLAADGVYYYIISAKGTDKVEYDLHGTVTLIK